MNNGNHSRRPDFAARFLFVSFVLGLIGATLLAIYGLPF